MTQKEIIPFLIDKLSHTPYDFAALVGLDGYIDTIKKVVREREGKNKKYFPTISDFAQKIALASGKSAQLEVVSQTVKLGGNAPLMANSLHALAFQTTCVGMLGVPDIHPLFQHIATHLYSLGRPADTTALEFDDGKLIMSDLSPFELLSWEHLRSTIGEEEWVSLLDKQHLVAFVGLSNLHHINALIRGMLIKVLPQLRDKKTHYFFDLADPSRKSGSSVRELLTFISQFSDVGITTLGVNQNEAQQLYRILFDQSEEGKSLESISEELFNFLRIDQLLVHPIDCALLVDKRGCFRQEGKLVASPKVLTGAGDHLNAGFCFGMLAEFGAEASLVLGMANSAAYISLGYTPEKQALIQYLDHWYTSL